MSHRRAESTLTCGAEAQPWRGGQTRAGWSRDNITMWWEPGRELESLTMWDTQHCRVRCDTGAYTEQCQHVDMSVFIVRSLRGGQSRPGQHSSVWGREAAGSHPGQCYSILHSDTQCLVSCQVNSVYLGNIVTPPDKHGWLSDLSSCGASL